MEDANDVHNDVHNDVGNDDNTVRLPLGRPVERYLYNLPILASARLRCQSRKEVNEAVAAGLITVERVPEAFDHLEWTTKGGTVKSTKWIEDLFGYQLVRNNALTKPQVLQAGLATVFDAVLLENSRDHSNDLHLPYDQIVRRNCARLLFLLDAVAPAVDRHGWNKGRFSVRHMMASNSAPLKPK